MIWQSLVLTGSILGLAIASSIAVKGGAKIAEYLGFRESAIGLLFIAVFTSLPELSVGMLSAEMGHPAISLANVIGSNIADILLVLGIGLLVVGKARINKKSIVRHVNVILLISIIPIFFLLRGYLDLIDGLALLVIFLVYCLFVIKGGKGIKPIKRHVPILEWLKVNLAFWGGMVIVLICAHYAVESTIEIAKIVGIPEWVIAIGAIAFGTSLPELAIDVTAMRRGHVGIAIGDILGSCVTNITLVLGSTLLLSNIRINALDYMYPISSLLIVNLIIWYLVTTRKRIGKDEGLIMVLGYVFFLLFGVVLGG